jgi:hypothetical protein
VKLKTITVEHILNFGAQLGERMTGSPQPTVLLTNNNLHCDESDGLDS